MPRWSSGPQFDAARVRSAQLVALQPELMLAIAVLSNGSIEKEVISNTGEFDDAQIARASAALDATLREQSLTTAPVVTPTGDRVVDATGWDPKTMVLSGDLLNR